MAWKDDEKRRAYQREWSRRNYERIKAKNAHWSQSVRGQAWKKEWSLARHRAFKDMTDTIKLERGCVDCGYREHAAALHFDHRDPSLKTAVVSGMYMWSPEKVRAEIDKCDVRCANCHAIRTIEEGHHRGAGDSRVGSELPGRFGEGDSPGDSGEGSGLRLFEVADLPDRQAG